MTAFTAEQIAIRDTTRAFVQREISPHALSGIANETVPLETVLRLGKLGLFGVCAPRRIRRHRRRFPRLHADDRGACLRRRRHLQHGECRNSFGAKVRDAGTPDQKERFLRPVASGAALGCLLMTEPHAGSDAAAMRTRAVKRGNSYVLNGSKCFITSGRSAEYAVIFAVTDPTAGKRGLSAFLTRTDRPCYRVVRLEPKLGHRTNDTAQIAIEDLEVPQADLLGQPGDGPAHRAGSDGQHKGRRGGAGDRRRPCGARGRRCLRPRTRGVRQADPRAPGDRLPARRDGDPDRGGAPDVPPRGAAQVAGVRCVKEASMAKLFASEMSERVCSAAIQVHGGYGYVQDFPVEKYYRDARVFQIYDGTNEVQKILISRELAAGR